MYVNFSRIGWVRSFLPVALILTTSCAPWYGQRPRPSISFSARPYMYANESISIQATNGTFSGKLSISNISTGISSESVTQLSTSPIAYQLTPGNLPGYDQAAEVGEYKLSIYAEDSSSSDLYFSLIKDLSIYPPPSFVIGHLPTSGVSGVTISDTMAEKLSTFAAGMAKNWRAASTSVSWTPSLETAKDAPITSIECNILGSFPRYVLPSAYTENEKTVVIQPTRLKLKIGLQQDTLTLLSIKALE